MQEISLKALLGIFDYSGPSSSQPVKFLSNDSRQVKPGTVYFAAPGYRTDGHRYIPAAIKAGAIAVVAQRPTPGIAVPQVIVRSTRQAQAKAAALFYRHPSQELRLTGITGTNGKTSSAFMLEAIFQAAGLSTGIIGTLYNKVKDIVIPTVNTSPDSILCQRLLRDMVDAGVTHASMEVSSHATAMNRVGCLQFALGAITNFSADHLDLHKNVAAYALAKKDFFDLLGPEAWAVVNFDDPGCRKIAADTDARTLYFSLSDREADVFLAGTRARNSATLVSVSSHLAPSDTLKFSFRPPGRHNLANALLAVTAALALGIDGACIAAGLSEFRGIYRRFEIIYDGAFRVIDDAAHNPSNLEAVFETLLEQRHDGVGVVYAIRGNRGIEINRAIASTLAHWGRRLTLKPLIITSCSDTASRQDAVLAEEVAVYKVALAGLPNVFFTDTLERAVTMAIEAMEPAMTLLLLGAHPMDDVAPLFSRLAGVRTVNQPRPPPFGIGTLDNG